MKVYKFGGGVIQDPQSVRKLAQLIQTEPGPLVVVVSALGKTTQALEEILHYQVAGRPYTSQLQALHQLYQDIVDELLDGSHEAAYEVLAAWQEALSAMLALPITDASFDKAYSCVVAEGELLTSKLIAYYLQEQRIACTWLDARNYVKTNGSFYNNAQVDWATTQRLAQKGFLPPLEQGNVILTQGFIGSNEAGETTTLGKEGSDFTGAILATVLGADSLTIWKDVPGVMSADPKLFKEAIKFDRLSYETVEKMAFHGAKVIHSKTIRPLAKHNIPLYVKPFHHQNESGTSVTNEAVELTHPIYILQEDQVLVELSLDDLTSFNEKGIQEVMHQLQTLDLQANLLMRDADQLTICLNANACQRRALPTFLSQRFKVKLQQASLITVLGRSGYLMPSWLEQKAILCSQQSEETYQAAFLP